MRYEVQLSRKAPDGSDQRAHWEAAARRGNQDAIDRLTEPPFPEELRYLWDWSRELAGRSGTTGMGDFAPLSFSTIVDWATLMDVQPTPLEVDALLLIDAAMRYRGDDEPAEPVEKPPVAWPEKKVG